MSIINTVPMLFAFNVRTLKIHLLQLEILSFRGFSARLKDTILKGDPKNIRRDNKVSIPRMISALSNLRR